MNSERASSLVVIIDQLIADGRNLKSQADGQLVDGHSQSCSADILGQVLLRAASDRSGINSRKRSMDAMDVTASAG
jgi:hypothetical protein